MARIDAALETVRWQGIAVRAIYLTEPDSRALDRVRSREYGSKLVVLGYRDHHIRFGKRSAIYSTNGVEIAIPKRLSLRVEPPDAGQSQAA